MDIVPDESVEVMLGRLHLPEGGIHVGLCPFFQHTHSADRTLTDGSKFPVEDRRGFTRTLVEKTAYCRVEL